MQRERGGGGGDRIRVKRSLWCFESASFSWGKHKCVLRFWIDLCSRSIG